MKVFWYRFCLSGLGGFGNAVARIRAVAITAIMMTAIMSRLRFAEGALVTVGQY